jgi:hypothetical protein
MTEYQAWTQNQDYPGVNNESVVRVFDFGGCGELTRTGLKSRTCGRSPTRPKRSVLNRIRKFYELPLVGE